MVIKKKDQYVAVYRAIEQYTLPGSDVDDAVQRVENEAAVVHNRVVEILCCLTQSPS